MKPRKKSPHPQWALKYRTPGTELRFINGKYYLYSVKSVYDAEKKRAKKLTGPLLGKVTQEEGFVKSEKGVLRERARASFDPEKLSIKEFGFSHFVEKYGLVVIQHLQQHFPQHWQMILIMAYCRMAYHSCIKSMPLHFHKSFLSERFNITLTDKKVSYCMRELGQMRETVSDYMKSFIKPSDHILFDMTNVFSSSSQIALAKEGYNSDLIFNRQVNLLYLFSPSLSQPVYYRLFPGNLREVKAFATCLRESEIKDAVVIADKGFYSQRNIENLNKYGLNYLIPLRRNNSLIKYELLKRDGSKYFRFNDRIIWYETYQEQGHEIALYYDGDLRQREEKDYLNRIETHPEKYTIEAFHQRQSRFGTIAIISNLKKKASAEQTYHSYKSRGTIELVFDGLKNIMKGDASYMHNEDALNGWMFVNHITLQWYYLIYANLKEKNLLKKYSVSDVVTHLKEIRKARLGGEWIMEPVIGSTNALMEKTGYHIT